MRAGFKLDMVTGEPCFDIGLGDIQAPQTTLDEIFAYLETADKPSIVAIDQFQQIGGYEEKNLAPKQKLVLQAIAKEGRAERSHVISIYQKIQAHPQPVLYNLRSNLC